MTIDDDATFDTGLPAADPDDDALGLALDIDGDVPFADEGDFEDGAEDGIYDAETLERINRTRPSPRPAASRRRRRGAAGAIVAAMLMGVGDVLDPQRRVEIEMIDPWSGEGNGSSRVRLSWDPVPSRTVARIVE